MEKMKAYNTATLAKAERLFDQKGKNIAAILDQYDVADNKVSAVAHILAALIAEYPLMKDGRIANKIIDHFNLKKLKADEKENIQD
jgi:hypothetical protein